MSRLKVGIIGCGAIAQVQHLPHLRELSDQFEIAALCDLSPGLLSALGEEYRVPDERRFSDYQAMLRSDVEAVIVCPSADHAAPSIAAAKAGKHIFVEKPMCTTEAQAREMVAAAESAGVVMQIGYMKRHDPAYQYAKAKVEQIPDVRFVQVNHLHCENSLHLREFKVLRFDDFPPIDRMAGAVERKAAIAGELGLRDPDQLDPAVQRAFGTILGSMIHDIGNLSGLFGPPTRVVSTEIWADGRGINTVLEYPDERRAVCTWVDLPELPEFTETLEIYGSRDRALAKFPTGFSRGLPSYVTVWKMDEAGRAVRDELAWHENPFKNEITHFRDCILNEEQPITSGRDAIADIALVRDIVKAYLRD